MTTSPDLGIPYIAGQQAQPEITHNTALNLLQVLSNGVTNVGTNTPPGSPTEGDSYVIGSSPTGAWAGRANCLTGYFGGAWVFLPGNNSSGTPITMGARHEGLRVWNRTADAFYVWSGSAWAAQVAGPSVQDEGATVVTTPSLINFVGAGVTATNVGGVATVTVPGGSQAGEASSIASADYLPLFDVQTNTTAGAAMNSTTRTSFMVCKVDSSITVTDVGVRVVSATASQTIDIALYTFLGAGKPGTLVLKGQCSTASAGVATGTVGTPVVVTPGLYFIALHATSTSPTFASATQIDLKKMAYLLSDGFSFLGTASTKYTTALVNDSSLPGGAYSYGMNMTGLNMTSGGIVGGDTNTLFVVLKKQ